MRVRLLLVGILLLTGFLAPAQAIVQTAAVVVGTSPTLVWTAPAGSGRVLVRNPSTVTVYLGTVAVTTTTGFPLGAGDAISLTLVNRGTLYGVVAAATQTVYTIQGDNPQ